jgi:hypothetical protein
MNDQQFSIGFKSGEFPGHFRTVNFSFYRLSITSLLVWQGAPSCHSSMQLHERDKVICQHLLVSFTVHHQIPGQKVEASCPNIPAVAPLDHHPN